jgi:hypothetical protein
MVCTSCKHYSDAAQAAQPLSEEGRGDSSTIHIQLRTSKRTRSVQHIYSQMSSSPPLQSLANNGMPSSVPRFRRLVPAPVSNSESTSSGSDQGPSLLSYLRPRAKPTKIACESCRKRRAKVRTEHRHVHTS